MAKLNFASLLCLSLCSLMLRTRSSEVKVLDAEDLNVAESQVFIRSEHNGATPLNSGHQFSDPLQEKSSDNLVSETQQPMQRYSFIRHQAIPKMFPTQQFPLNHPIPYYPTPAQQPQNIYPNPIQLSNYKSDVQDLEKETTYHDTPYRINETCINTTLLANVEKLLEKIQPELVELNKTRALLWDSKRTTLEIDRRISPICTVGGRSLTLGPRKGLHCFMISHNNGQIMDALVFDLTEPGNSARLISFLDAVAVGSYVVIVSGQDAFLTPLSQTVVSYFITLGSRSVTFLAPGDRWIFVVQVRSPKSLPIAEAHSNAPECPTMNYPSLVLFVPLILE